MGVPFLGDQRNKSSSLFLPRKQSTSPQPMLPKNLSGSGAFLAKCSDHSNTPSFFTRITNPPSHSLILKGNSMPQLNTPTFGGISSATRLKMALSSSYIVQLRP